MAGPGRPLGEPVRMGVAGSVDVAMADGPGWKRLQVDLVCEGWLIRFSVHLQRKAPAPECRRAGACGSGQPALRITAEPLLSGIGMATSVLSRKN